MTAEKAEAIIRGLKDCAPRAGAGIQLEEATRWVLYEIWCNFGDEYFAGLEGTWAGEVLARMQAHYQRRVEARRIHNARQCVKRREWKE